MSAASSITVDAFSRIEGRVTVPCRFVDRVLIALWPWTMGGAVAPGADLRTILEEAESVALRRCAADPVATIERACRGVDLVVRELAPPRVEVCRWHGMLDAEGVASRIAATLREAPPITPANAAAVHADLIARHARWPMHTGVDYDALDALGWLRAAASTDTREGWAHAIELCARECASVAISHASFAPDYGVATWEPAARLLRAILSRAAPPRQLPLFEVG